MKSAVTTFGKIALSMLLAASFAVNVHAQQAQPGDHSWPDTLATLMVTGKVIVNLDAQHPQYFLDIDDDAEADYHLSFGPWWYEATSGAVRPDAGEEVEIYGALMEDSNGILETILVLEIDGLVWRTPVEYGTTGINSEPVWDVQNGGPIIEVTGKVFVDTTYFYNHYYLDTTGDTIPEYKLGLGPYWYEPASGAVRPEEGDEVTIVGRLHDLDGLDLLTVLEIDGLVWREPNQPAPWAGEWVPTATGDTVRVRAQNSKDSWIAFPAHYMGGNGNGGGNMPWPDSVFVQFWEIHPDSIPGPDRERRFIGFFVSMEDSASHGLMIRDRDRIRLHTEEQLHLRIRYFDRDLERLRLHEDGLALQYWDEELEMWRDAADAEVDTEANLVTVAVNELASFYSLVAPASPVAVEGPDGQLPTGFVLEQNYPNPFNPSTVIPFSLKASQHVTLSVYDMLGRKLHVLIDQVQPAGSYEVAFEAGWLPAGAYMYQLKGNGTTQVRTFILAK